MKRATPSLIGRFVKLWNRLDLATNDFSQPIRDEIQNRWLAWWRKQL